MKTLKTEFTKTGETYVYDNGQYGEIVEVETRMVYEIIANGTCLYVCEEDKNLRKIRSFSIGYKGLNEEHQQIFNSLLN